MPQPIDPYEVLEVSPLATQEEIKRAYRTKAREYHPDVNPGDPGAEERFKTLKEAYELLTSPTRGRRVTGIPHGPSMEEIFRGMFEFRPPRNMEISVPMRLIDLVNGTSVTIKIGRHEACGDCDGNGGVTKECLDCAGSGMVGGEVCGSCSGTARRFSHGCPRCYGSGQVSRNTSIDVVIPPGLNVSPLVIPGMGHRARGDESAGDLIVMPRVTVPPGCQIIGRTKLMVEVGVDPILFIVGGMTSVSTALGDQIDLRIPEHTNFGAVLGIPDMGLPTTFGRSTPRDSLVIRLLPEIPDVVSDERAELLREYVRLGEVGRMPVTSQ